MNSVIRNKSLASEILHSQAVGGSVVVGTIWTGLASFLDYIPDDITKLASLLSAVLIIVLIRAHLTNTKKTQLEIEALEKKKKSVRDE